jgi:hypothetical protein
MAPVALTNAFIYVDSHDFTGDGNQLSLDCEGQANDRTTFRSEGWREYNMATKTSSLNVAGFWQAGADSVDEWSFTNFGSAGRVTTIADVETEGLPAFMLQAMNHNYQFLGQHGENAPFTLQGGCSDGTGVVRGFLAKEWGTVSATGATGTALNLGAVGASQFLYATFHVFGTPGTTITGVVESDDANTFASATTRITFGPYTTAGGRWGTRVAGSITDTWYRLRITAITGTFTIACAIGIQ